MRNVARRTLGPTKRHALGARAQIGPDNYDGRALGAAHKGLDITHEAFDEVGRCLLEVLVEASVENDDVDTIMGVVGSTRDAVVAA